MNGQELLFDFYQDSFSRVIGINFQRNEAERNLCIEDYFNSLPDGERTKAITALTNYRQYLSPKIKTNHLIKYLSNSNQNLRKILDFGCGNGAALGLLVNRFNSIETAFGIDTDPDVKSAEWLGKQKYKIQFHSNRSVLKDHLFDLILAIHTFHHISKGQQEAILQELIQSLHHGGILYLVEDSWSVENHQYDLLNSFDKFFFELDEKEKTELLEANEYWSNKWCYGKKWENEDLFYRTVENWEKLIIENGLTVRLCTTKGFDTNRLHGVPSLVIIAQR